MKLNFDFEMPAKKLPGPRSKYFGIITDFINRGKKIAEIEDIPDLKNFYPGIKSFAKRHKLPVTIHQRSGRYFIELDKRKMRKSNDDIWRY